MKAIGEIRSLMNKQCFLSGLSTISLDTKELADSEAPIYIAIAIALAMVAMTLSLKSWILPWVLLLGLSLAVVYNFGTNIFFGQISYITQCIAAILQLGVTMDYSVFLVDRYEEEREKRRRPPGRHGARRIKYLPLPVRQLAYHDLRLPGAVLHAADPRP